MTNMTNKPAQVIFWTILFLLFLYLWAFNTLTPLMGDDFGRTLFPHSILDGISQIIYYTKSEYLTWSGRVTVSILSYIFFLSPALLNFINAIVSCCLVYGIFLNAVFRQPKKFYDIFTLLLIIFILWFFFKQLAETVFWKTVAIGYLWPVVGSLFLIYPFVHLFRNQDIVGSSSFKLVVMVLSAFFLAACLENLSVTIAVFLIGAYIWQRYHKQIWPLWAKLTTVAYLLGVILLFAAPGNLVRAHVIVKVNAVVVYPLSEKIPLLTEQIYNHFATGTETIPLLILAALALLSLLIYKPIKHKKISILFILLSLIAAFAMLGVPGISFINRVTFPSDVFFTIAMLAILCQLGKFPYVKYLYAITAIVCIGFVIPKMLESYQEIKFVHQQYLARVHLLNFYRKNHASVVIVQPMFSLNGQKNTYNSGLIYRPTVFVLDALNTQKKILDYALWRYYGFNHRIIMQPLVELWSEILPYVNHTQAKNNFKIFHKDNGLFYVNTQGSCANIKNNFPFFIRITPKNSKDLVKSGQGLTYNSLAFTRDDNHTVTVIDNNAEVKKDVCVLEIKLPSYPIRSIETGQRQGEKILWIQKI